MKRGREELRRGIRELIEHASEELEALADATPAGEGARPPEERPILRLVRDPLPASPVPSPAPQPPAGNVQLPDVEGVLPKKGVCAAYFVNKRCWEVPEAYCNTALHVCMMRECPVYHLYREELERRFAAQFAHFW